MAKVNKGFDKGIRLKPSDEAASKEGDIRIGDTDKKVKAYVDGAERDVVTADQSQTVTNKTIDADNNTISNIETDNLKSGVLITDVSTATSDTELPSALAVKTALEGQNDASEIVYDPATNAETISTNVQGGLDDTAAQVTTNKGNISTNTTNIGTNTTNIGTNATDISDHIADASAAHAASAVSYDPSGNPLVATDSQAAIVEVANATVNHINESTGAHAAGAISNTPSGNLAATDQQSANNELQSDIDTRALASDLTTHESDTSTHGVSTVAGISEAQVITNKDIDGGTASNTSRVTVPKASKATLDGLTRKEATIVYASDEDKLYVDDGSDLIPVGSGSGEGNINYITNSQFETNLNDWNLYDDGDVDTPVDGTGGSPSRLSKSGFTGANALRGSQSLGITNGGGASARGEGVSSDFTIDNTDQAKMLTISIDLTNTGLDSDFGLYVYDVTNTKLIPVNGQEILSGEDRIHIAQFQTSPDSISYRLIIHNKSNNIFSRNIILDNVQVGPRDALMGDSADSMIRLHTGNGYGSTNNKIRRFTTTVDEIGGAITYSDSATLGATFTINDTGVYTISSTEEEGSGSTAYFGISLNSTQLTTTIASINAADRLAMSSNTGTSGLNRESCSWSGILNKGDVIRAHGSGTNDNSATVAFTISKQGSSASDSISNREIVARGAGNGSNSITANTTNITFTETEDTSGSFDGAIFTAPDNGDYDIFGCVRLSAAVNCSVNAYIDGTLHQEISDTLNDPSHNFSGSIKLDKGDQLSLRLNGSATLSNTATQHHVTIVKRANPQTILDTTTVACKITSNNGQTVNQNATVKFEDTVFDTHNAYSSATGRFVAPVSGYYHVSAKAFPGSATSYRQIMLWVNGVQEDTSYLDTSGSNEAGSITIEGSFYLEKDDYVEALLDCNVASVNLGGLSTHNVYSIHRIK